MQKRGHAHLEMQENGVLQDQASKQVLSRGLPRVRQDLHTEPRAADLKTHAKPRVKNKKHVGVQWEISPGLALIPDQGTPC